VGKRCIIREQYEGLQREAFDCTVYVVIGKQKYATPGGTSEHRKTRDSSSRRRACVKGAVLKAVSVEGTT